jgi:hypothetical protein
MSPAADCLKIRNLRRDPRIATGLPLSFPEQGGRMGCQVGALSL